MTASTLVILAMTLAPHLTQQAPPRPRPATPVQSAAVAPNTITLTGCAVPSVDREDTLQLVAAEPDKARPVGTAGVSPAWTVPAYLLLGGMVSFAEHANKTVEITGTLETTAEAPDPRRQSTTTTAAAIAAPARLHVQSAKVIAATCTPKQPRQQKK
jgi:hypothetical protein